MVKIEGLKLAPGQEEALLRGKAARLLRVPEGDVLSLQVLRRSVDAREELRLVYTAAVELRQEKAVLRRVRDRRGDAVYAGGIAGCRGPWRPPRRRRWSSARGREGCLRPWCWPVRPAAHRAERGRDAVTGSGTWKPSGGAAR